MKTIKFKVKIAKQGPRARIIWIPKEHREEVEPFVGQHVIVQITFPDRKKTVKSSASQ